jgi:predicted nucleic acid-binding protein
MTTATPVRVVVDSSAVVALLVDAGPAGQWVETTVAGAGLSAPDLLSFEVANILRRHALAGIIDATAATLAHADLLALPIDLYPYAAVADRAWALRANLTIYDASYVALAEALATPLVTLDASLARASGLQCTVLAFSGQT